MNTKIIMTLSAATLGVAGIILTFLPDTMLGFLGIGANGMALFLMQILGALYFAFAMLNWMTRFSVIGGIYNRPIVVANFTHFLIAGLALVKGLMTSPDLPYLIWILGVIYASFAVCYGLLLFRHPVAKTKV